jgi:hypothetical protein
MSLQTKFSNYLATAPSSHSTFGGIFSSNELEQDEQDHRKEAKKVLIDITKSIDLTPDPLALDLLNSVYSISSITKNIKSRDKKSSDAIRLQLLELKSRINQELDEGEEDTQFLEEELSAIHSQIYQKDHLNLLDEWVQLKNNDIVQFYQVKYMDPTMQNYHLKQCLMYL